MANLSQKKRQRMMDFLKTIRDEHKDDDAVLAAIGEIETELNAKKYGLVWEQHEEAVDVAMRDNIPVFADVTEKEISAAPGEGYNFLLEGDNLHSLYLLEKTHKGKIDVIYIDPPYNTGNRDFVYDDAFVDKEDGFRHSKWLSFMNKRLQAAKRLLRFGGLLFINIDDNEVFQIKLLCDEIFGENNFVLSLPRQTKRSGKTTGSFSKNNDYVLVYVNGSLENFKMQPHVDKGYKLFDEYANERGPYKLNQTLDYDSLSYSQSLDYPLEIDGEVFYPGSSYEKWQERQSGNHNRADWAWRWNRQLFEFGYANGFVVIKRKKDGSARIYTKTYLNAKIEKDENGNYQIVYTPKTKALSSLTFTENEFSNDNAKKDLRRLGLDKLFDYSKPVALIKALTNCHADTCANVLDFFAGSGTTAQAVLELNQQDGGNRHFILCTNNENNICEEVTYPRIRTVITGKRQDGSEYSNGIPTNFKYFKTDFVSKDAEDVSKALLEHISEMVELENGVKIDDKQYLIVLSDDAADELEKHWADYPDVKEIYLSHDVLLTTRQNQLFGQVPVKIIPDYYFKFEMKEVGEAW
ncbi:MAG: site-specific DNA-methyltransferase [Peptoniphilaceae bacterium]|nr:site-specific DNA-methyltransferase [Peptoniphilaceae bacterium]